MAVCFRKFFQSSYYAPSNHIIQSDIPATFIGRSLLDFLCVLQGDNVHQHSYDELAGRNSESEDCMALAIIFLNYLEVVGVFRSLSLNVFCNRSIPDCAFSTSLAIILPFGPDPCRYVIKSLFSAILFALGEILILVSSSGWISTAFKDSNVSGAMAAIMVLDAGEHLCDRIERISGFTVFANNGNIYQNRHLGAVAKNKLQGVHFNRWFEIKRSLIRFIWTGYHQQKSSLLYSWDHLVIMHVSTVLGPVLALLLLLPSID